MIFFDFFLERHHFSRPSNLYRLIVYFFQRSLILTLFILPQFGVGQSIPDAGALLRQNKIDGNVIEQQVLKSTTTPAIIPMSSERLEDNSLTFVVTSFRFTGATLLSELELQQIVQPWVNRMLHFHDLEVISNVIIEEYHSHGWFVRVVIPEQDIDDGIVTLNFIEMKLGRVRVVAHQEHPRFHSQTLIDIVTARQKIGDYLNVNNLDRASNLLGDLSGVISRLSLAPGEGIGVTDVVIDVEEKPRLSGLFQIDNNGTLSTGLNRITASLNIEDPRGIDDQISFNTISSSGSEYGRISYTVPFFTDGLHVGAEISEMRYHLIGDFASLDANGSAQTRGLFCTYPALRLRNLSMSMSCSLEEKIYKNNAAMQQVSDKKVRALTLGVSVSTSAADESFTLLGSNITLGKLCLSANPKNEMVDLAGAHTEGVYGKINLNFAHLQHLSGRWRLWFSIKGQLALKNLDSSEKFSLGGLDGVSAYPNLEATADNGVVVTTELRKIWNQKLQTTLYYEFGAVTVNHFANYPGATQLNDYSLADVGISSTWNEESKYSIKASVSRRLGINPAANSATGANSDGSIGRTRYWLSASFYF